ncbi:zinc finger protein 37-like [Plutella xylostella]|uniref:zinc finger protein 37-like n=1 Tax=Plutella xylostella TaxID=51655 RepID=UPI0020321CEB|nr:zinc finger protein 37-like [Plutella xylostella]
MWLDLLKQPMDMEDPEIIARELSCSPLLNDEEEELLSPIGLDPEDLTFDGASHDIPECSQHSLLAPGPLPPAVDSSLLADHSVAEGAVSINVRGDNFQHNKLFPEGFLDGGDSLLDMFEVRAASTRSGDKKHQEVKTGNGHSVDGTRYFKNLHLKDNKLIKNDNTKTTNVKSAEKEKVFFGGSRHKTNNFNHNKNIVSKSIGSKGKEYFKSILNIPKKLDATKIDPLFKVPQKKNIQSKGGKLYGNKNITSLNTALVNKQHINNKDTSSTKIYNHKDLKTAVESNVIHKSELNHVLDKNTVLKEENTVLTIDNANIVTVDAPSDTIEYITFINVKEELANQDNTNNPTIKSEQDSIVTVNTNLIIIEHSEIALKEDIEFFENFTVKDDNNTAGTKPKAAANPDKEVQHILSDKRSKTKKDQIKVFGCCDHCSRAFRSRRSLIDHLSRSHSPPAAYCCPHCHYRCVSLALFTKHSVLHDESRPFQCDFCSYRFLTNHNLRSHLQTHMNKRAYSCPLCDKTYTRRYDQKKHMRMHDDNRPYECTECDAKFTQSSTLRSHMRLHTGEKSHTCNVCERKFVDTSKLKKHMRSHTGERPYECEVCKKRFRQTSDLYRHKRTHTGEKPYKCSSLFDYYGYMEEACERQFSRKYDLVKHVKMSHDNLLSDADIHSYHLTYNKAIASN